MKKINLAILTAVLLTAGLSSCKKYEEGPALSFRSKYERVVNTWEAKYVFRDALDYTAWFDTMVIDLMDDGRFVITDFNEVDSTTTTQEGFWDLVNDNEQLRFVYSKPAISPDRKFFNILKLKEDELWYEEVTDSVTWTFRLIPGTPADSTN